MLQQKNGVIGLCYYPDFIERQDAAMENLLDHFAHIASLIGTEHIGLGQILMALTGFFPALKMHRQFHCCLKVYPAGALVTAKSKRSPVKLFAHSPGSASIVLSIEVQVHFRNL